MKERIKRSEEELKLISEHLWYEVQMLVGLSRYMSSGGSDNNLINNAVLEAYTIHARLILDFLTPKKPKPDDVLAIDFLEDVQEWVNLQKGRFQQIEKIRTRVGKEVAHLTYRRLSVTPDEKPWEFVEITDELMDIFRLFIDRVPRNYLCEKWFENISSNGNDGKY